MRTNALSPLRWPAWVWLGGLSLIFFIRFPINFILFPPFLMDFDVYRAVSVRIVGGGASALYDSTSTAVMMFKYAPFWALAWIPLAWLPPHAGAIFWATKTVAWLILACAGAQRLCAKAGVRAPGWLAVAVVSLLVRSLTGEFLNGQVDILWGLLVIGFLLADALQRPWWAAASLALAISLKLPALIFLPYLLVRRRVTLAVRVLAIFLALNAVTCVALEPARPFHLIGAWASILWSSGPARAFEIGNQSLLALATRFLSADGYRLNVLALSHGGVFAVTLLISAALFALVVFRLPSRADEPVRSLFDGALLTILMVLCSPTVWTATYSALIFPVGLAVACAVSRPGATWRDPLSVVVASAVVVLSVLTHSNFWHAIGVRSFRGESYIFLVLMALPWLGLALFVYLWRQRQMLLGDQRPPRPA